MLPRRCGQGRTPSIGRPRHAARTDDTGLAPVSFYLQRFSLPNRPTSAIAVLTRAPPDTIAPRMTTRPTSTRRQILAWTATLDGVAVIGSLLLACMTPFVGLAVAAALTLPRRAGAATVLVAWGINQAIGYGVLHYPTDGATIGRGVAIGVCALLAFAVARFGRRADGVLGLTRTVAAFVVAFAVYEVALYGSAVLLGGVENFTPAIIAMIGTNDAAWFAGMMAVHLLITTALPARFGRRPRLAIA